MRHGFRDDLLLVLAWLALMQGFAHAQGLTHDVVANARLVLSGALSEQKIELNGPGVPPVTVDLRSAVEADLLKATGERFAALLGTSGIPGSHRFVVQVNVTDISYDFNPRHLQNKVLYKVSFKVDSPMGESLAAESQQQATGDSEICWTESGCVKVFEKNLPTIYRKSLASAFGAFLSNPDTGNFIKTEFENAVADAGLLSALEAHVGTYRITELEGVVRLKPRTSSRAIQKYPPGSLVSVDGKLPNGWLRVTREGEPIGWIHGSSVAAPGGRADTAPSAARPPAPASAAAAEGQGFPMRPVSVTFKPGKANPDDIAVIIGNANYKATARDIPDVVPAYADAESMKRYATQALGVREENVIYLKDARLADLIATFGNDTNPRGRLWNWVRPGRSQVFVYYVGHGAPSSDGASSYLVPVDAQASLIDLSSYSLKTLYGNLGKLPAKSVTVVLEACFSGATQSGLLVKNASPVFQKAQQEIVPENLTVITAGSGNQIASWEPDKSASLFTKHYLLGMAGAADRKPYGNSDGKVDNVELGRYLGETLSYSAQRHYGREQTAQIMTSTR